MTSLQGYFLIASPHLSDTNFRRSVVLLLKHSDEGAFGLVLNRPTDSLLSEVWELISESPCKLGEAIHIGGPVGGPLMALHSNKTYAEALRNDVAGLIKVNDWAEGVIKQNTKGAGANGNVDQSDAQDLDINSVANDLAACVTIC